MAGNPGPLIVLMLENRSFDHMLGNLYGPGLVSPTGQPFDGLTGKETNPDESGKPVSVSEITPATPNAYLLPGVDPEEGFAAADDQMYGDGVQPAQGQVAPMNGFVTSFADSIAAKQGNSSWNEVPGTVPAMILANHTPESLPILSKLAAGYAVSDAWYASIPTETIPNRAYLHAGTSQGAIDDSVKSYTAPTIYSALTKAGATWKIYGYTTQPLTRSTFTDLASAPASNFGTFADYLSEAAAGTLPDYVFLEPSWGSSGNSQHPNYNVALGEQLIHDTYYGIYGKPQWNDSMLVITYDEPGGMYDHVSPPWGATPPDSHASSGGFTFNRFGGRVPTVFVSPLIEAGTVYRAPAGGPPLDHTSVLATLEARYNIPPLTARDAAAPSFDSVRTLSLARTDDPLSGVAVPQAPDNGPSAGLPSHLQQIQAELLAEQTKSRVPTTLTTEADFHRYIEARGMLLDAKGRELS